MECRTEFAGWDPENPSQVRHERLSRANLQQWMKIILHDSTTGANLIPQPENLPPEAIMEHLLQCSKILCWLQLQYLLEDWENYYNFLSGGRTMLSEKLPFLYLWSLQFLHTFLIRGKPLTFMKLRTSKPIVNKHENAVM